MKILMPAYLVLRTRAPGRAQLPEPVKHDVVVALGYVLGQSWERAEGCCYRPPISVQRLAVVTHKCACVALAQ